MSTDNQTAAPMKQVKLQSSDGQVTLVDRDVAERSILIKNLIEDFGMNGDVPTEEIPLMNVSFLYLPLVIARR